MPPRVSQEWIYLGTSILEEMEVTLFPGCASGPCLGRRPSAQSQIASALGFARGPLEISAADLKPTNE